VKEKPVCDLHDGLGMPRKGWFVAEFWCTGKIGLIGDEPSHPYCEPIPFKTREAAVARSARQKLISRAAGNTSMGSASREKHDLVIGHDVWSYDWLKNVLESKCIRERMIYLLPRHLVPDADALFEASLTRMQEDRWSVCP